MPAQHHTPVGVALKNILVRPATDADFAPIWDICLAHAAAGVTSPLASAPSKPGSFADWLGVGALAFVAVMASGRLLGVYTLAPNQSGGGAHVAHASYLVCPSAKGVGIGRMLGEHSMAEAARQGYRAMQFNFVVSTNQEALTLCRKLGFSVVGTLPEAYRHRQLGYVDAYVMYRRLDAPGRGMLANAGAGSAST
jgi:L-amino acid N-acyltransferase YncA